MITIKLPRLNGNEYLNCVVAEILFGCRWAFNSQGLLTMHRFNRMLSSHINPKKYTTRPDFMDQQLPCKLHVDWCRDVPKYSEWEHCLLVIQNRQIHQFWCSVETPSGLGLNPDKFEAAFYKQGHTDCVGFATAESEGVAICLAALQTEDVHIQWSEYE